MAWTEEDLVYTVNAFLAEGVPPGVVSRVFNLDEELVKSQQKKVRVERYGTADMDEYLEQAQWDAIDWARQVLAEGKPADQARVMSQLLRSGIAAGSKRLPDSVREGRDAISATLESMKGGGSSEARRSRFVVVGGDGA